MSSPRPEASNAIRYCVCTITQIHSLLNSFVLTSELYSTAVLYTLPTVVLEDSQVTFADLIKQQ